ncbi:MAG TPA: hypothetical protein VFR81_05855, partial [Longimicrobium sp.]|nr:hypothetical protein [Longimicrobium sp.]
DGEVIGISHFGHSAPATRVFKELGFSPENVAAKALRLLGRGGDAAEQEAGAKDAGPAKLGTDEKA